MTRARALTAAGLVLAAGLAVHGASSGAVGQVAGGALYAALLYALVLIAEPRTPVVAAAAVSLELCWLVELTQLTPYPAELSARSTLVRLVLGSTFSAPDLLSTRSGPPWRPLRTPPGRRPSPPADFGRKAGCAYQVAEGPHVVPTTTGLPSAPRGRTRPLRTSRTRDRAGCPVAASRYELVQCRGPSNARGVAGVDATTRTRAATPSPAGRRAVRAE